MFNVLFVANQRASLERRNSFNNGIINVAFMSGCHDCPSNCQFVRANTFKIANQHQHRFNGREFICPGKILTSEANGTSQIHCIQHEERIQSKRIAWNERNVTKNQLISSWNRFVCQFKTFSIHLIRECDWMCALCVWVCVCVCIRFGFRANISKWIARKAKANQRIDCNFINSLISVATVASTSSWSKFIVSESSHEILPQNSTMETNEKF